LFAKYVSADVFSHVQAHPELLKLEGERREITVFFSDLKGFTTISETMPPEKLSQIMNDYLTPMTEIIMAHQGYLDKYIGDAIMAVFGAPMPDPDHALNACIAAVKQRDRLRDLARELEKASGVRVSARMGVNTGTVCAGNMGSRDRFQYTVMGDVVNQASRFEGANKIFGSGIMIGETTYLAVQSHAVARKLAHLTVKGKTQAVVVYELLTLKGLAQAEEITRLADLCRDFSHAVDLFAAGDIPAAESGFEAILALFPEDGPTAFYLRECHELMTSGMPADFSGGIKLETK
jgi:adenylate cyclase